MLGKLAKTVAYVKAPKRTFALFHPVRALKYGAAFWMLKKAFGNGRRKERSSD